MDNRRLILLMVFSFSLIMLWDAWQRQNDAKIGASGLLLLRRQQRRVQPLGRVPTPTLPSSAGGAAGATSRSTGDSKPR
jgi:YidC/Oxa1 family membrane protein insertase